MLEVISVVLTAISVVFPIVKFIIKEIQSKNNGTKTQQNTSTITGNNNLVQQQNNNFIQQQNTEKKTVIINKYYNYSNKSATASDTETSVCVMIILGVLISLVLCYVFIMYNTIIISAYLIAFSILMFALSFSPLTRKHKIILYFINIVLLISVLMLTYKEFWNSDVLTLYNQLFEDSNLSAIISYAFHEKLLIAFQVVLVMLVQLIISITSVTQCIYLLICIVRQKIKGFGEDMSNKALSFMIRINGVSIVLIVGLILIILISFTQNRFA